MAAAQRPNFALQRVAPDASQVRRYETLQVRVEIVANYDNPFDPTQIRIDGEFLTPSGKRLLVPGFFKQDFERVSPDGTSLRPVGAPSFAVRFTPTELGTYRYRIVATGQGKRQVTSQWLTLKVSPNPSAKGFVRRGKFWHLRFDDGTPFVPVGLNVCWSSNNLSAYERWFS
ncbi:MAG: hypothetical protein REDVDVYQ_000454, partial [Candidatus Fervidibacter sp.]